MLQSGLIAGGLADGRILVWDAGKLVGSAGGSSEPTDITKQDKSGGAVSTDHAYPFQGPYPLILVVDGESHPDAVALEDLDDLVSSADYIYLSV